MVSALRIFLLTLLVVFVRSKLRPGETPAPEFRSTEGPLRAAGGARCAILYPREAILGPTPPFIVSTPGDGGPLDLWLRTAGGASLRWKSRERSVAWPDAVAALRAGEGAFLQVWSGAGYAESEFRWRPWSGSSRAGCATPRELLHAGYPSDALLQLAREPKIRWELVVEAAWKAGLPPPAFWRNVLCSGNL